MDHKDKKDEIILQQLEVIQTLTEHNLRRMGTDFWGAPREAADAPKTPPPKAAQAAGETETADGPDEAPPPEKLEDLLQELEG